MTHKQHLLSLFKCKAWADSELHAATATLGTNANPTEKHNAIRILNHIHVVDKIFIANLQGQAHGFTATNTEDTPQLDELSWATQETDAALLKLTEELTDEQLEQVIEFKFADGDKGKMSRSEMLMHVIMHGTYHRGSVGRILTQQSVAAPRDLYTKYLHTAEPARRNAA
jgi:uncharacterized damage-inducible protein DinB